MSDLRREAKGRDCQGRFPSVCNFDPATTVLAHIRMPGITGTCLKSPDLIGAHLCSACHDEADRRTRVLESDYVRLLHLEAVIRTQYLLIREGLVKS